MAHVSSILPGVLIDPEWNYFRQQISEDGTTFVSSKPSQKPLIKVTRTFKTGIETDIECL